MRRLTSTPIATRSFRDICDRGAAFFALAFDENVIARETPKLLAALAPDERVRHACMATSARRNEYLAGRLLIRGVLAALLDVPLSRVPLAADSRGRPHVRPPAAVACDFNLSHSCCHAVLGVTRSGRIGVDVEAAFGSGDALVRRFLGADERARLLALPRALRNPALARAWVVKEAWSKALGVGLQAPLQYLDTGLRSQGCARGVRWRAIGGLGVPAACAIVSDCTPPPVPRSAIAVELSHLCGASA